LVSEVLRYIFHEFNVVFHHVVLWQFTKEGHTTSQDERSLEMIHRYCFYCSLRWYSCDPNTCAKIDNVCLDNFVRIIRGTSSRLLLITNYF